MKGLLILTLTLGLACCSTGVKPKQQSYLIAVHFKSPEQANTICQKELDHFSTPIRGCAIQHPPSGFCKVITPYDWKTITHELEHCFTGHWHPPLKKKRDK